jgi:hypothetical protein
MNRLFVLLALLGVASTAAQAAPTLYWRAESATFDGTDDFSAGSTTLTSNGSPTFVSSPAPRAGTNSVLFDGFLEYYSLPLASIFSITEGSYSMAFRLPVWGAESLGSMQETATPSDHINVFTSGTDGAGGVSVNIRDAAEGQLTLSTGDIGLSAGEWYSIIVRWHQANQDLRVEVYDAAADIIDFAEDLAVTAAFFATGIDTLFLGDLGDDLDVLYDQVFIADAYDEPIEDFLGIGSYTEYGGAGGSVLPIIMHHRRMMQH